MFEWVVTINIINDKNKVEYTIKHPNKWFSTKSDAEAWGREEAEYYLSKYKREDLWYTVEAV